MTGSGASAWIPLSHAETQRDGCTVPTRPHPNRLLAGVTACQAPSDVVIVKRGLLTPIAQPFRRRTTFDRVPRPVPRSETKALPLVRDRKSPAGTPPLPLIITEGPRDPTSACKDGRFGPGPACIPGRWSCPCLTISRATTRTFGLHESAEGSGKSHPEVGRWSPSHDATPRS